jgi:hypothetical protein
MNGGGGKVPSPCGTVSRVSLSYAFGRFQLETFNQIRTELLTAPLN